MTPKLTKAEVREILLRQAKNELTHGQNFFNCIAQGDADYSTQYSSDPMLLNRAKADIRNSKILYYVRQLVFENPESYQLIEDANSFYVRIENCLHVRFKKLDEYGRSSPGKTKRDTLYRQQNSACLPFVEQVAQAVNLDVGYILNATGVISEISFSCCAPSNAGVYWRLPAKDLNIVDPQQTLFAVTEEEIIPVLQLELKDHLTRNNDERQANDAV